jgi:hypothetical protein
MGNKTRSAGKPFKDFDHLLLRRKSKARLERSPAMKPIAIDPLAALWLRAGGILLCRSRATARSFGDRLLATQ